MQQKREADNKYQHQREEYERLQQELVGNSEQANKERAELTAKQQKMESERQDLVRNYEQEIVSLRQQNQEYQRHLEHNISQQTNEREEVKQES